MAATELRVVPRLRRVDANDESLRFEPSFVIAAAGHDEEALRSTFETLLERETNERVVRGDDEPDPDVTPVTSR